MTDSLNNSSWNYTNSLSLETIDMDTILSYLRFDLQHIFREIVNKHILDPYGCNDITIQNLELFVNFIIRVRNTLLIGSMSKDTIVKEFAESIGASQYVFLSSLNLSFPTVINNTTIVCV